MPSSKTCVLLSRWCAQAKPVLSLQLARDSVHSIVLFACIGNDHVAFLSLAVSFVMLRLHTACKRMAPMPLFSALFLLTMISHFSSSLCCVTRSWTHFSLKKQLVGDCWHATSSRCCLHHQSLDQVILLHLDPFNFTITIIILELEIVIINCILQHKC